MATCKTHGHLYSPGRCVMCGTEYSSFDPVEIPLRDQLAMAAMQGILSACHGPAWGKDVFPLAESAYEYADQMLKVRAALAQEAKGE